MRSAARALSTAALAAALAGCGGNHEPQQGSPLVQGWNAVDGMLCADGSPTGVGVSLGTTNRVLVVLSGGGACWSGSCAASVPRGPFGATEFAVYASLTAGTILDRSLPGNPFADWNLVFVPYCTGDVHAGGDVTMTYGGVSWRHHGRANLDAAMGRVAAAFPAPERIAVAGFSAGGFGALLAFDLARARWPAGAAGPRAYLVDDSGQTFVGNDLPQALRDAWWASWNLDATITPLCPACKTDLSALWTVLHAAHPTDRLALLTTTQDATMSAFFGGMTPTQFETGVTDLAATLAQLPNAASFRVSGTGHALLLAPASYATSGGTALTAWLGQQVTDGAGWTSAGP